MERFFLSLGKRKGGAVRIYMYNHISALRITTLHFQRFSNIEIMNKEGNSMSHKKELGK